MKIIGYVKNGDGEFLPIWEMDATPKDGNPPEDQPPRPPPPRPTGRPKLPGETARPVGTCVECKEMKPILCVSRGLCDSCYKRFQRRKAKGKASDSDHPCVKKCPDCQHEFNPKGSQIRCNECRKR